jgi:hypothetical protein
LLIPPSFGTRQNSKGSIFEELFHKKTLQTQGNNVSRRKLASLRPEMVLVAIFAFAYGQIACEDNE